ncbi:MAG: PASTA domain-containing protein [Clostridia bacterium]|nr:PASTA domain-containing protein [Clostridia bacterium]
MQVLAASQWLRDLPLSAKRGDILDRNGVLLATSETTYDIYVRARSVDKPSELAKLLSENLNIDFNNIYNKVTNISISESLVKLQVEEGLALRLANSGLKGIYLSQNVGRVYPYSALLTQVLGFCSIDNVGQTGLESYYNKYLKGVDGKSLVQANAQGLEIDNSLAYYIPSIAGANMTTTIDVSLQIMLEKYLNEALIEHKAKGVTGIILDATNGDILAMSNLPDFDLNNVPRDNLSALFETSKNKAVVDVYEPGSTFKIITMAGALNEGLTNIDERFYCGGSCTVDGERIKCWRTIGHGSQTLVEGFKNSCNCVFVQLALRLGVDGLYKYMDLFGIGSKTGVDVASESSGIVMNKSLVKNVDLARIGFGQSVAVTSLQLTSAFGFITSGKYYTPHLIQNISTEKTNLYTYTNTSKSTALKSSTVKTINMMLANNINTESAYSFVSGYDVGGKTGTAQKFENGAIAVGKYVSSFIGVYPTSSPKYILFVSVNEPSNGVYYGGMVAKPVGQKVFEEMFKIKNIPPDDESQLTNQPDIVMPNVVGSTIATACANLKALGLNVNIQGEGGYVVGQLPLQDTRLYQGEEVLLTTN